MILVAALVLAFPWGPGVRTSPTVESDGRPYLQWELRSAPIPGHEHSPERHWFQDAVVLHADDGSVRWRAVVPDRMRDWQVGIGNAEAEAHRQYPRTTHNLYFLVGLEWTDVAVAIADPTGVLVLSLDDGHVLKDLPFANGGDALWFDAGTFRLVDKDGETLGSAGSRGGTLFSRVGDEWIYFNGVELAAIDIAFLGVRDRTTWDPLAHRLPAKTAEVRARMPLGRRTVEIDGVIHLR